jgi:hypothetical protein
MIYKYKLTLYNKTLKPYYYYNNNDDDDGTCY